MEIGDRTFVPACRIVRADRVGTPTSVPAQIPDSDIEIVEAATIEGLPASTYAAGRPSLALCPGLNADSSDTAWVLLFADVDRSTAERDAEAADVLSQP